MSLFHEIKSIKCLETENDYCACNPTLLLNIAIMIEEVTLLPFPTKSPCIPYKS